MSRELARFLDGPIAGMEKEVDERIDYIYVYLGHGADNPQIRETDAVPLPRAIYRRAGWQGGRAIFRVESVTVDRNDIKVNPVWTRREDCMPAWTPANPPAELPTVKEAALSEDQAFELALSKRDRKMLKEMGIAL